MRGLNHLSAHQHHVAWQSFQCAAVEREINKVLLSEHQDEQQTFQLRAVPLFPGAMMFNQIILIKSPLDVSLEGSYLPQNMLLPETADSFDSYYESFNRVVAENELSGTVIIDCSNGTRVAETVGTKTEPVSDPALTQRHLTQLEHQVELLNSEYDQIDTVLFLQKESYRLFRENYSGPLKIRFHQPDWRVFAEILYLYRCAAHVIFVNNLRVLDAAYSACNCSAVVDDAVDPLRHEALLRLLENNAYCHLLLQPSIGSPCGSSVDNISISLCDNNRAAFTAAISMLIKNTPAKSADEDFIESIDSPPLGESNIPVINVSAFITSTLRGRLVNRRIKFLRKANKLREDPKTFCKDSSNVLIRSIGSVIPEKKAANG